MKINQSSYLFLSKENEASVLQQLAKGGDQSMPTNDWRCIKTKPSEELDMIFFFSCVQMEATNLIQSNHRAWWTPVISSHTRRAQTLGFKGFIMAAIEERWFPDFANEVWARLWVRPSELGWAHQRIRRNCIRSLGYDPMDLLVLGDMASPQCSKLILTTLSYRFIGHHD